MTNKMPKETEIDILNSELKKMIGEKYQKMKGFFVAQGREIDLVDYLMLLNFHNIDNNTNIKDIIAEGELEHLKNDLDITQILHKIKLLMK